MKVLVVTPDQLVRIRHGSVLTAHEMASHASDNPSFETVAALLHAAFACSVETAGRYLRAAVAENVISFGDADAA